MTTDADLAPYGAHAPDWLARTVLALTRRLPANRLGLRLSMPLRRVAISWLGDRPVDTTLWDARVRLYPSRNSCEKNALFTPQMFDLAERTLLAQAFEQRLAEGKSFTFVDVGANVGAYSIFIAALGGDMARSIAIEPQPGIVDRLNFNLSINPGLKIQVAAMAVSDREGEVELVIDRRDRGGSHVNKGAVANGGQSVRVRCRPLTAILADAGVTAIDAMKIDIEGAEDLALGPFLRLAPRELLPRFLLLENRPEDWSIDLYGLLREAGYAVTARSRINLALELRLVSNG